MRWIDVICRMVSSLFIAALTSTGVRVYIVVHTKLNQSAPVSSIPPHDALSQIRLLADKIFVLLLCYNVFAEWQKRRDPNCVLMRQMEWRTG
jgi:hypothetical protein